MAEFAKRVCIYGLVAALVCWWLFDSWLVGVGIGVALAVVELVFLGVFSSRRQRRRD